MSDKSYAEQQGRAPFDWNKALDNASANGISQHEHEQLSLKSGDWVSCACGNQCAIIPRHPVPVFGYTAFGYTKGTPVDGLLQTHGVFFHKYVTDGDWESAKDTLAKIEARSAILIAEELAKLNAL